MGYFKKSENGEALRINGIKKKVVYDLRSKSKRKCREEGVGVKKQR